MALSFVGTKQNVVEFNFEFLLKQDIVAFVDPDVCSYIIDLYCTFLMFCYYR